VESRSVASFGRLVGWSAGPRSLSKKNGLDISLICDTLIFVDNCAWCAEARSRFSFFQARFPVASRLAQLKTSLSESSIYGMQIS
jgi:hypothetical protein